MKSLTQIQGFIEWLGRDTLSIIDQRRREDGEVKRKRKLGTVEVI